MSVIQGYIPAIAHEDENQIYYCLKKTQASERQTLYDGFVGYATPCAGPACEVRTTVMSLKDEDACEEHHIPEDIHTFDTTKFSCIYDSVKNCVTIMSPYRYEFNSNIYPENFAFALHFDEAEERSQIDSNSYPYVRFPRSKDGVSISRICLSLFSEFPMRPILYFPAK